jgi:hypothetical protein
MIRSFSIVLLTLFFPFHLFSQTEPTPLSVDLVSYMTGLINPVDIAFQNDTMFIVDQEGRIRMALDGLQINDHFLEITDLVQYNGERGLLGLAFDPDFNSNRTFYVNYTDNDGNTIIAAYKTFPDSLMGDPTTATILVTIAQPFTNHNGGQIKFGPDGYLYVGMGDGGSSGDPGDRSQNPLELLGKMLRYEVNADEATIPDDNPFVNDTTTLDDIWALGLRNPWRFSFDMDNGDLWIGDVGQNFYEEVNYQSASSTGGENWGWRCREGFHAFNSLDCGPASDYDEPILEYDHNDNRCSITGGYVYRGSDSELLNGVYLAIDYCSGYLFGYRINEDAENQLYEFSDFGFGYTAFGQDDDGEMYVANADGTIYKITDTCHTQIPALAYSSDSLIVEVGANYYWFYNDTEIEGWNQNYLIPNEIGVYYVIVENEYGCDVKSNTIDLNTVSINSVDKNNFVVYPNPFTNEISVIGFQNKIVEIKLYSISGKQIFVFSGAVSERIKIPSSLQKGSYILQLKDDENNIYNQLIIKK